MKLKDFDPELDNHLLNYTMSIKNPKLSSSSTWVNHLSKFENKMRQLGWKMIGDGAYSIVYKNPKNDYVLKVNKVADRAFSYFVNLISKHQSIHFPHIKAIREFGGSLNAYLIEPLYSMKFPTIQKKKMFLENCIYFSDKPYASIEDAPYPTPTFPLSLKEDIQFLSINKSNYFMDIHADNLMQRKDKTIVIIDPYSQGFVF